MFSIVLLVHIIAAVSVGPILMLPFLVKTPAMLAVLRFLRFGAAGILVTGITLWVVLHLGHPAWLVTSAILYVALCVLIGAVLEPAAERAGGGTNVRARLLAGSIASCVLTLVIIALMVLRPGEV